MTDPSVRDLTAALGKHLSLTVEEDVGLDLDDGDEAQRSGGGGRWCLVGTVLTRKKYNLEAMENTLAGIWRPVKGMHMRILGNNFFAFYFFYPVDMQRVLAVGPWRFADHVMVLQESAGGRPVKKEDLFEVPFWIQIHGLPPDRLTAATGRRIGGSLGRLVDVDTGDGIGWGVEYIRIRVFIDSRKPLRRGMTMTENEGPFWVDFRYERLPNFCYCCGMLDHVERDCELGLELESLGVMERPYSRDLRAGPKRGQHDAALQVGRWLRDASGNPVVTAARRRWPSQYMEGMPNLESQKCHDESSPQNWRMIETVTAGLIDRDCCRDLLENPVNPTDREIISQREINHIKIGHHHPIKNAVAHGNNESESTPFVSEGHNHRQESDSMGPIDLYKVEQLHNVGCKQAQVTHEASLGSHAAQAHDSNSIFLFTSPQSSNPPHTRAWKREARNKPLSKAQSSQAISRVKRKDGLFQTTDNDPIGNEKRGRGKGDNGVIVVL
ncbi:hypothetical protein SLEP1_g16084 [Rubroshorea leprosula]|uniref:CCHC-type domain-containing protein n=1 Tax=Rubroshorea leprosula TaxID=152421 RepID=A0AAV5IPL1_9ROSI|nr:hypothetical protein SLEP1_g16084 [Rubroshorea leprosula]